MREAQDRVQIPSMFWVRKKITWELLTWEMCTAVSEVQLRPSYETKPVFKTLPHLGFPFLKKKKRLRYRSSAGNKTRPHPPFIIFLVLFPSSRNHFIVNSFHEQNKVSYCQRLETKIIYGREAFIGIFTHPSFPLSLALFSPSLKCKKLV